MADVDKEITRFKDIHDAMDLGEQTSLLHGIAQALNLEVRRKSEAEIENEEFEERLIDFVHRHPAPEQQLETMTRFWGYFHHEVPTPDSAQWAKITNALESNPDKKLIPAPLLDMESRHRLLRVLSSGHLYGHKPFSNAGFDGPGGRYQSNFSAPAQYLGVSLDPYSEEPGKMDLGRPDPDNEDKRRFAMGFKHPDGRVIYSRHDWAEAMVQSGHATRSDDGVIWLYPLMNINPHRSDGDGYDYQRYEFPGVTLQNEVDPTHTAEAAIAAILLYHLQDPDYRRIILPTANISIVNEALYELDLDGEAMEPADQVVQIRWSPDSYGMLECTVLEGRYRKQHFYQRSVCNGLV